jgi:hypothetical protein
MVKIQKTADLCLKQYITTISTFALITKVGKTDKFPLSLMFFLLRAIHQMFIDEAAYAE